MVERGGRMEEDGRKCVAFIAGNYCEGVGQVLIALKYCVSFSSHRRLSASLLKRHLLHSQIPQTVLWKVLFTMLPPMLQAAARARCGLALTNHQTNTVWRQIFELGA